MKRLSLRHVFFSPQIVPEHPDWLISNHQRDLSHSANSHERELSEEQSGGIVSERDARGDHMPIRSGCHFLPIMTRDF